MLEQSRGLFERAEDRFRHAVVQERRQRGAFGRRQRPAVAQRDPECRAALDAFHRFQPAMARDVGRFRRPWGNGADARHDQPQFAARLDGNRLGTVGQNALEARRFITRYRTGEAGEMPEFGLDSADAGNGGDDGLREPGCAEGRESVASSEPDDERH
ncbi:hypothetical protein D3C83_05010 [compost metagenome]